MLMPPLSSSSNYSPSSSQKRKVKCDAEVLKGAGAMSVRKQEVALKGSRGGLFVSLLTCEVEMITSTSQLASTDPFFLVHSSHSFRFSGPFFMYGSLVFFCLILGPPIVLACTPDLFFLGPLGPFPPSSSSTFGEVLLRNSLLADRLVYCDTCMGHELASTYGHHQRDADLQSQEG
jgi:hypothetical protein